MTAFTIAVHTTRMTVKIPHNPWPDAANIATNIKNQKRPIAEYKNPKFSARPLPN